MSVAALNVFVLDQLALTRKLIAQQLEPVAGISVVGSAGTVLAATRRLAQGDVDVLVLDVDPKSEQEIVALSTVLKGAKIPIVHFTTLDPMQITALAERLGVSAEHVFPKPLVEVREGLLKLHDSLVDTLRRLGESRRASRERGAGKSERSETPSLLVTPRGSEQVIAVGASTGGTEALGVFLRDMPPNSPGIAIVQHMPVAFVPMFAAQLGSISQLKVKVAEDGDPLNVGHVLVAPGDRHLELVSTARGFFAKVCAGEKVSGHCPSVDVLMASAARAAGRNGIGVLLTGMGRDGADGLLAMRQAGAVTFAQDEASSVVFGMPGEAHKNGAAQALVPLSRMAEQVRLRCSGLPAR